MLKPAIADPFQESSPDWRRSPPLHLAAPALLCPAQRKAGKAMSQGASYLIVASGMIVGFLFIRFIISKINQRRQSRRIDEGIAQYLRRYGENK
jgi:hypothetical protein